MFSIFDEFQHVEGYIMTHFAVFNICIGKNCIYAQRKAVSSLVMV